MGAPGTPRREVVTGAPRPPRTALGPVRPYAEDPAVDTAAVRALIRRQFRLSASAFGLLVALVGLLPLAFTALPDPAAWPGGALIVWAVLGIAVYPALVLIGRWYVVRAERNERDTADPVGRA